MKADWPRRVAAALAIGLATTTVAVAANAPASESIRFNASDQALARAATLRRSDLGREDGPPWRSIPAEPVLLAPIHCPAGADMSMFVVSGAARTRWLGGIVEVDSQSEVFAASWMLRGEWRRRVRSARALDCERRGTSEALAERGDRLVSFRTIALPHLRASSLGLRIVVTERGLPDRLLTDVIVMGRSRTAI